MHTKDLMSSLRIDPFAIPDNFPCSEVFSVHIDIATPASFLLVLAQYIFLHAFNLYLSYI